jgi:uroporphyrinogen decarboxylase
VTSKERVEKALRREGQDRLPIYMWFHPETADILSRELEIPSSALDYAMGNDVRQTWVANNQAMEGIVHEREGDSHTDPWGITWTRMHGFNQISRYPFAAAEPEVFAEFSFPYRLIDELMKPMERLAESSEGYFLGCDVSPCAFEMYWRLRGMEDTFIDMACDTELFASVIRKACDFAVRLSEEAFSRFHLDWLWTGDDVASQSGLLFSPGLWREVVKPELKRVFDVAKGRGVPVAYHCCGSLYPIIGDLIEIGMDVLNPVQPNCPGMNPPDLKKEFGYSITFMGGVDTQGLLPNATALEVRRYTRELIDTMTADGGGYILAASHTIPPETPLENIFAMYAEAGISREEIFDRASDARRKR